MSQNALITGCAPESLGSAFLSESYARGFYSLAHFRNRRPHQISRRIKFFQSPLHTEPCVEEVIADIQSSVKNISLLILAHGGYTSESGVDMRFSDLRSRLLIAQGLESFLTENAPVVIIGSNHGRPGFNNFSDLLPRQREYADIYRDIHGLLTSDQISNSLKKRLVIPVVGGARTSRLVSIADQLRCSTESLTKTTPDVVAQKTLSAALDEGHRGLLEDL